MARKAYEDSDDLREGQEGHIAVSWESATNAEKAEAYATIQAAEMTAQAWTSLQEGWEGYMTTLNEAEAITEENGVKILDMTKLTAKEISSTVAPIRKSLQQAYRGTAKITNEFVAEHFDTINKMLEGDVEALDAFEEALIDAELGELAEKTLAELDEELEAAAKDADGNPIDIELDIEVEGIDTVSTLIDSFIDKYEGEEIGTVITPEIDNSGYTAALVDIVNQGGEAAAAVNAAMASMGYDPVVSYAEITTFSDEDANGVIKYRYEDPVTGRPVETEMIPEGAITREGKLVIPRLNADGSVKIGGFQKKNMGGGGGGKKGGGGGGGGGDKKPTARKKYSDIERYHEIEDTLEAIEDEMSRIEKLRERAFGEAKVQALKEELKLLEQ
jgi:hypothetical protein